MTGEQMARFGPSSLMNIAARRVIALTLACSVLPLAARASQPAVPAATAETPDWFPFEFPLNDTNRDTIDLSGFLDPAAGRHGFVSARPDGHFHFVDGKRARFFGTNVGGPGCSPSKEKAVSTAARLAKYGVNPLRLHAFDSPSGKLIDYAQGNSQQLNAATLDRMDFFIAELKKRGIYVYRFLSRKICRDLGIPEP